MSEVGPTRLPGGLRATLWAQLVIAALFFALGLSHNRSMNFGRPNSLTDIVGMGTPLLLVLLFWWAATQLWRRGQVGAARLLVFTPLLAAMVLATLAGIV